jgi:hypothetical protein
MSSVLVVAVVVKTGIGMLASAAAISVVAALCRQLMDTNEQELMVVMAMSFDRDVTDFQ